MKDLLIATSTVLQRALTALDEFRTTTSKNFNPSDIDEICDAGSNLIDEIDQHTNEGAVAVEITWQDVNQVFPSLSKEDCVEFMVINKSGVVARMKDAALKSIIELGINR